jgi:hypothetical protein
MQPPYSGFSLKMEAVGISATFVVHDVLYYVVLYCSWMPKFRSNMLPSYSEFPLNVKDIDISTTFLVKIVIFLLWDDVVTCYRWITIRVFRRNLLHLSSGLTLKMKAACFSNPLASTGCTIWHQTPQYSNLEIYRCEYLKICVLTKISH